MKKITIYFNDTEAHYTTNIVEAKAGDGLVMLQRGDGSSLDNTMIPIHRIRWIDIVDAEEEKDDPHSNEFLGFKTSEVKYDLGTDAERIRVAMGAMLGRGPIHLKELSKGERRVNIGFNPSKDVTVAIIKRMAADLIDKIEGIPLPEGDREMEDEVFRLKAKAQTDVEQAAMWAVKAATKHLSE